MKPAELERYARHFVLPGVGVAGQEKLKQARVLCIGAGGVGSPVLTYLAAAGVGHLAVMDADCVDSSNLQRQILFTEDDLGRPKALAAQQRLQAQNSMIQVQGINENLTIDNALEVMQSFDLVIDGSDNFTTRFLVNDACVQLNKPFISASVFQFSAQLALLQPKDHSCYRCLFPEQPRPDELPNCNEAGVFGAVTGMVGTMACSLALNYLLGEVVAPVLYQIDAKMLSVRSVKLQRNEDCPACRQNVAFPQLLLEEEQEHQQTCEAACLLEPALEREPECSVDELESRLNQGAVLLDVRELWERALVEIPGHTVHMPLGQLEMSTLDASQHYIVYCKVGARSAHAVKLLSQAGFDVENLAGGIMAWQSQNTLV
ncbi:putative adenylyltransferase/sulfurtransferase MoeZ [Piscirickettsia salmonis]|uniref:HesA/MoeB/ThiF family protein n=1 Tax=Piscirickettsia salmonis TaxID=1238 RepID=UPI0012B7DA13|nr:HesA/MoeB/ThiF family protein [Piscirickettsia salmonis]QGP49799.1 putative adenylyltransferase/sulfurtransferase MoeZ [Piscirickettsia salmonis]QGP55154.1 putative adenylyltransferase/sulfurtransferase MoeZ [Piscirickettsia salmonis]QGP58987.1 putative adenylyltransferase/sulfurtransferase MoeZ [Piscirickettsia salmonis]QGP64719.1 putative adenylyltransferase/sulfurtransferase MoeZ [Piscirickettsia salmonis]